jgi:hypothetical protein
MRVHMQVPGSMRVVVVVVRGVVGCGVGGGVSRTTTHLQRGKGGSWPRAVRGRLRAVFPVEGNICLGGGVEGDCSVVNKMR